MTENAWPGITTLNHVQRGPAAQAYAAGGLPVFPVFWVELGQDNRYRCACGDSECDRPGKHPLARWKSEATTDPDVVHGWWARWPQANIGIPTGAASNLLVLDLDRRDIPTVGEVDGRDELERWCEDNHVPWPLPTLEQRTGGGGGQLVFRHVEGARTLTAWLPGVDVRAEGGYILAPPSGHVSGGTYSWLNELGPLEAPERLAAVLRVARGHATGAPSGSGQTADYDYGLAKLEGPPPGARDHFFNAFAFEMRANGVDRAEAERRVTELWERCDHDAGGGFALAIALDKVARVWHDVPAGEARGSVTTEEINIARRLAEQHALGNGNGQHRQDGRAEEGGGGGTVVQGPWVTNDPPLEVLTDAGNAYRFARLFGDQVRYVPGRGWLLWDDLRWKFDTLNQVQNLNVQVSNDIALEAARAGEDEARRRIQTWAQQTQMITRVRAMLDLAKTLDQLAVEATQLDSLNYLLNTPDGEYHVITGVVSPHTREHLLTRCTNVSPSTVGSSPRLEEFFLTFMPPDPTRTDAFGNPDPWQDRKYLMRVLGSCLLGGNKYEKLLILYGGTYTGKSTVSDLLKLALGDYCIMANPSVMRGSMDDKPRPDLLATIGPRVGIVPEASSAWDLHVDAIKQMTSDTMTARDMFSSQKIDWKPSATFIIVANELPHIKGIDPAMKRRVLGLPFIRSMPVHLLDTAKKTELLADPTVAPAFLAELLQGCREQSRYNRLEDDAPHMFNVGTADVLTAMDDVAEWEEYLVEHGILVHDPSLPLSQCAGTREAHTHYKLWIYEHGSAEQKRNALGLKAFSQRLAGLGWQRAYSNGPRWVGRQLRSSVVDRQL